MNSTNANEGAFFNGVAVIIDDKVNTPDSDAAKLKEYIMNNGIPLAFINEIPIPQNQISFIKRIYDASFIILDWIFTPLSEQNKLDGVAMSQDHSTTNEQDTIDFLKKLLDNTYCPIFIVSNENKDSIEASLCACLDIKGGCHHPRIFIHNWGELSVNNLFQKIDEWVSGSPIIQTLKVWEESARKAKLSMFSNLESKNINWPTILFKTFKADNTNESIELTQTLSILFENRMYCDFSFLDNCIDQPPASSDSGDAENMSNSSKSEIRSVLEGTRFIPCDNLNAPYAPGDLFESREENGCIFYWLNIRAQCSLLHITDPELYCVRGTVFDEKDIVLGKTQNNKHMVKQDSKEEMISSREDDKVYFFQGQLHNNRDDAVYMPFVYGGKIIEFDLKTIKIKKTDAQFRRKHKRIGRILPPFITRIQQIVSSFIVREGLPAIPIEAFSGKPDFPVDESIPSPQENVDSVV